MPRREQGSATTDTVPGNVADSIDAVVALEEAHIARRTLIQKVADGLALFFGTLSFIALHFAFVGCWVGWNIWSGRPFDPAPFPLLNLIVATEAVTIGAFVLGKQTRTSQLADRRAHLDLQVNVLTEKEVTKTLQLLMQMMRHIKMDTSQIDTELDEMSRETAVERLAHELHERLPENYT